MEQTNMQSFKGGLFIFQHAGMHVDLPPTELNALNAWPRMKPWHETMRVMKLYLVSTIYIYIYMCSCLGAALRDSGKDVTSNLRSPIIRRSLISHHLLITEGFSHPFGYIFFTQDEHSSPHLAGWEWLSGCHPAGASMGNAFNASLRLKWGMCEVMLCLLCLARSDIEGTMAPKQKAMPRPPTGSKWEEMGINRPPPPVQPP